MLNFTPPEVISLLNIWPDACEVSGCLKAECACIFCELEAAK